MCLSISNFEQVQCPLLLIEILPHYHILDSINLNVTLPLNVTEYFVNLLKRLSSCLRIGKPKDNRTKSIGEDKQDL